MGPSRREARPPPPIVVRGSHWVWLLQHVCSESGTFDEAPSAAHHYGGGCWCLATRRPHQKCHSRCRGVATVEKCVLMFDGKQITYCFPCSVGMQIMTFSTPLMKYEHFLWGRLIVRHYYPPHGASRLSMSLIRTSMFIDFPWFSLHFVDSSSRRDPNIPWFIDSSMYSTNKQKIEFNFEYSSKYSEIRWF